MTMKLTLDGYFMIKKQIHSKKPYSLVNVIAIIAAVTPTIRVASRARAATIPDHYQGPQSPQRTLQDDPTTVTPDGVPSLVTSVDSAGSLVRLPARMGEDCTLVDCLLVVRRQRRNRICRRCSRCCGDW